MKQVKIFSGPTRNVEYYVNDFLRSHDGEIIDIKIIPTERSYDNSNNGAIKVMVIYEEKEDVS